MGCARLFGCKIWVDVIALMSVFIKSFRNYLWSAEHFRSFMIVGIKFVLILIRIGGMLAGDDSEKDVRRNFRCSMSTFRSSEKRSCGNQFSSTLSSILSTSLLTISS